MFYFIFMAQNYDANLFNRHDYDKKKIFFKIKLIIK